MIPAWRQRMAIAAFASLLAFGAAAQQQQRATGLGPALPEGAEPDRRTLSLADLTWCIQMDRYLAAGQQTVESQAAEINRAMAELQQAGAQARSGAGAPAASHMTPITPPAGAPAAAPAPGQSALAAQQTAQIEAQNGRIAVYNANVNALAGYRGQYNQRCSGRPYLESDYRRALRRIGG